MSRIGLIDVDGGNRFPNLALMKISAWHKGIGDTVEWYDPMYSGHFDKVYMSKVFSFTPDFEYPVDADEIEKGGTGYCISLVNGKEQFDQSNNKNLPDHIEHIYPDYSIYPELTRDTAFGFLTRGCPRGCEFCIVGPKEGRCSVKVADLSEFWRGQKHIVLCDPNILACRDWRDLLQQCIDSGAEIDFNQGLDIRLMTEEKALMISQMRIKEIHFAWDRYGDRDIIIPKLKLFADASPKIRDKKIHTAIVQKRHGVQQHRVVLCFANATYGTQGFAAILPRINGIGFFSNMVYVQHIAAHCDAVVIAKKLAEGHF